MSSIQGPRAPQYVVPALSCKVEKPKKYDPVEKVERSVCLSGGWDVQLKGTNHVPDKAGNPAEQYMISNKKDYTFGPYRADICVKKPGSDRVYGFSLDAGSHLILFDTSRDDILEKSEQMAKELCVQWNVANSDPSRCGMRLVRREILWGRFPGAPQFIGNIIWPKYY
jgi:hypothetical protein